MEGWLSGSGTSKLGVSFADGPSFGLQAADALAGFGDSDRARGSDGVGTSGNTFGIHSGNLGEHMKPSWGLGADEGK